MSVTALRLEDGERVLELRGEGPRGAYRVSRLDIGFPSVRAVTQPRPDADGEDDTTVRYGAAAVSLDLMLLPRGGTLRALLDGLRAFCHPSARPYLVVEQDGEQRRIRLRVDQQSAPITNPSHQQVQAVWRAPDGVMEDLTEQIWISNAVEAGEGGRAYPRAYPLSYAASSPVGSVTGIYAGTADVWPVLRLYGPSDTPRVEHQATGDRLLFPGLTLLAGDWLEIDCRNHTIRLNGLVDQSRHDRLDFAASTFISLVRGVNTLRYYPVSFGDGARMEARFRPAWL